MTLLEDLTTEQKEMLIHSKKRYEEMIEQINLFGPIFSLHINKRHDSQLDCLYHDIVSRIAQNLYCLTIVPPQDSTVVATRLILRSLFSDLILALALLCYNKSEAERICLTLSLQSLYSSFLRLSQTEHYSISGRQMSKFNRDEIFFFSSYSDWLAVAVHCLLKALVAEYDITEFEPQVPTKFSTI